jgi:hypothetical protein
MQARWSDPVLEIKDYISENPSNIVGNGRITYGTHSSSEKVTLFMSISCFHHGIRLEA